MFKLYGIIGILLIILVEVNFFFQVQPLAKWYFPIVWVGYILLVDAIVYKLKKDSILSSRINYLIGLSVLSALFWWIFELINFAGVSNWSYSSNGGAQHLGSNVLLATLSFSTVLPAFFETVELLRTIHLFDKTKLYKSFRIKKSFLKVMMVLGALCFLAPFIIPKLAFPLVWLSFFLILDPINYLHKQPSIIGHLKDRKLKLPLSLLLGGIIMGFLWEFWNYYAYVKWTYNIPYVGFFKIFEMPILGYLGYFPFAFELYAMYWFARSMFVHKEHILE